MKRHRSNHALVAPRQQRRWQPIPARRLEFCQEGRAQGRMAKRRQGAEPKVVSSANTAALQSRHCHATGCTPNMTSIVHAGSFSPLLRISLSDQIIMCRGTTNLGWLPKAARMHAHACSAYSTCRSKTKMFLVADASSDLNLHIPGPAALVPSILAQNLTTQPG